MLDGTSNSNNDDDSTAATSGESNTKNTNTPAKSVERVKGERITSIEHRGPSKRGSLKGVFDKVPSNRGSVVVRKPDTKLPLSADSKAKSDKAKSSSEPHSGRDRAGILLPRQDQSSEVGEEVASEVAAEVGEEVGEEVVAATVIDPLDAGFILPAPIPVVVRRGMIVVNITTRRRFTVLRKYLSKDDLFDSLSGVMWVLGLDSEEYLVSEKNLYNKKMYRLLDVDDFDDYESPAYRIYLPRHMQSGADD